MYFADKILAFHKSLQSDWKVPEGVDILYPFNNPDTWAVMTAFFKKYFSDPNQRIIIFGINPGRFGGGITGTPFTDPKILESVCGIDNPFPKRNELSAIFVYEYIAAYGGPDLFYKDFYITSLCPLGFVKDGKNYNYYDDKALQKAVEPHIIHNITTHIDFGCNQKVAFCMGQGKNYKYFKNLNDREKFFEEIIPLPHPRWVMQYKRKRKDEFVITFVEAFQSALS